jgi:hypothetical protein
MLKSLWGFGSGLRGLWALKVEAWPRADLPTVETVRFAMLDAAPVGCDSTISHRISRARDVEELWGLRPELLNAIADLDGESAAHDRIAGINAMFAGRARDSQAWWPGCRMGSRRGH